VSSTTIPSTEEERKDYVKQHKVRVAISGWRRWRWRGGNPGRSQLMTYLRTMVADEVLYTGLIEMQELDAPG